METDDLVKCPLCHGRAQVGQSDLLALLSTKNLREALEARVVEFTSATKGNPGAPGSKPGEFANEVHHWNPNLQLWRRSAKE